MLFLGGSTETSLKVLMKIWKNISCGYFGDFVFIWRYWTVFGGSWGPETIFIWPVLYVRRLGGFYWQRVSSWMIYFCNADCLCISMQQKVRGISMPRGFCRPNYWKKNKEIGQQWAEPFAFSIFWPAQNFFSRGVLPNLLLCYNPFTSMFLTLKYPRTPPFEPKITLRFSKILNWPENIRFWSFLKWQEGNLHYRKLHYSGGWWPKGRSNRSMDLQTRILFKTPGETPFPSNIPCFFRVGYPLFRPFKHPWGGQ